MHSNQEANSVHCIQLSGQQQCVQHRKIESVKRKWIFIIFVSFSTAEYMHNIFGRNHMKHSWFTKWKSQIDWLELQLQALQQPALSLLNAFQELQEILDTNEYCSTQCHRLCVFVCLNNFKNRRQPESYFQYWASRDLCIAPFHFRQFIITISAFTKREKCERIFPFLHLFSIEVSHLRYNEQSGWRKNAQKIVSIRAQHFHAICQLKFHLGTKVLYNKKINEQMRHLKCRGDHA